MYKYTIDAVHPVLKRVIKHGLLESEKDKLITELKSLGYEDIQVEKYDGTFYFQF